MQGVEIVKKKTTVSCQYKSGWDGSLAVKGYA